MSPWIDRKILVANAKQFVRRHGYFFRTNAARISSLVEISVYNSIVQFYASMDYEIKGANLGPKKSFKYKLIATGLAETHSYFTATKDDNEFHILNNIRLQSAHDDHLYYTADVVVTNGRGTTTQRLQNGRRHSFVEKENLITFAEVKHINPFPEALFNFSGLVLEFMPGFIEKKYKISDAGDNLCPIIAFTGAASEHAERIRFSLTDRYGFNIVFGTSRTSGKLTGFDIMKRYAEKNKKTALLPAPTRRILIPRRKIRL